MRKTGMSTPHLGFGNGLPLYTIYAVLGKENDIYISAIG